MIDFETLFESSCYDAAANISYASMPSLRETLLRVHAILADAMVAADLRKPPEYCGGCETCATYEEPMEREAENFLRGLAAALDADAEYRERFA